MLYRSIVSVEAVIELAISMCILILLGVWITILTRWKKDGFYADVIDGFNPNDLSKMASMLVSLESYSGFCQSLWLFCLFALIKPVK